jgi:hypothetical protein
VASWDWLGTDDHSRLIRHTRRPPQAVANARFVSRLTTTLCTRPKWLLSRSNGTVSLTYKHSMALKAPPTSSSARRPVPSTPFAWFRLRKRHASAARLGKGPHGRVGFDMEWQWAAV